MSKEACKRPDTSDSLELEMQVVVSQGGGTGNRIQVLFKNSTLSTSEPSLQPQK